MTTAFDFQVFGRRSSLLRSLIAAAVVAALGSPTPGSPAQGPCQASANTLFTSCRKQASSDYFLQRARCFNLPSASERHTCLEDALDALDEAENLCSDQRDSRLDVCSELGNGFYAPAIDPSNFVAVVDNPYFSLLPGTTRHYESHADGHVQTTAVHVSTRTKVILGVTCTVVEDSVLVDGHQHERTIDWFAQDAWGNVWYFGELSMDFEDDQIVSLDGSWRAGVDGAQPGIVMKATPHVGDIYRQEYLIGEAEDLAEVLSLSAPASVPAGSFPNCVKTEETTALEPDAEEHKFYASGVGMVLELDTITGTRNELVSITYD